MFKRNKPIVSSNYSGLQYHPRMTRYSRELRDAGAGSLPVPFAEIARTGAVPAQPVVESAPASDETSGKLFEEFLRAISGNNLSQAILRPRSSLSWDDRTVHPVEEFVAGEEPALEGPEMDSKLRTLLIEETKRYEAILLDEERRKRQIPLRGPTASAVRAPIPQATYEELKGVLPSEGEDEDQARTNRGSGFDPPDD
jgi:hypothetical protein